MEPETKIENPSKYDPSRPTVGAIYIEAQKTGDVSGAQIGDISKELLASLVDDLNATIASSPFGKRSFYITVHEKKDLQMPKCILRRLITTLYRPYPEDDTTVFWADPTNGETKFCWCLPHWAEMQNVLMNEMLFNEHYVDEIRAWRNMDLFHFGFAKDPMGNWVANPYWKDKRLG